MIEMNAFHHFIKERTLLQRKKRSEMNGTEEGEGSANCFLVLPQLK